MRKPDLFVHAQPKLKLAVYTWGKAPTAEAPRETVVLLHGFPDRAMFWDKVATQLSRHFYVVAYDMRGCGASSHITGRKHYRYAPLIDDLFDVIDAVSPKQKVHLVGHDWGGLYGWDALYDPRANSKLASFVTMAPSLNQVGLWMRKRMLRPTPHNIGQLLHQSLISNGLMTFFAMPILPTMLWKSGLATRMFGFFMRRFEGLTYVPNEGVEGDAIRYLGIYQSNLLQQALMPKRPVKTAIPVHALIASKDPFLPTRVFEGCRDWASQYSESTVDAAHWAPLSQPAILATTIKRIATLHPACGA
ncbi:MAG: alpha/beta fold hydrolase [Aquabacterium sp.]|nr:alpha/beta fold hydrolase [Aquabacterium sp.]